MPPHVVVGAMFGTTSLLLLCNSLLLPPHLIEGVCGGEKEISVLASLLFKRKIRDGVMAKALLPLLALHNRDSEKSGTRALSSWGCACNFFLQVPHPRGSKDFRVSQGHI